MEVLYQVQNWPSKKTAQYGCTPAQPESEPIMLPSVGSQAPSTLDLSLRASGAVLTQVPQVCVVLAAIKTGHGWVLLSFPLSFLPDTGHIIPLQDRWKLHGCGCPERSSVLLFTYFNTLGAFEVSVSNYQ